MSNHFTLSLASFFIALLTFPLFAQTPPAQPETFLHRASEITASIQKDFYNKDSALYAQTLTKRDPEFMWGNGIMFTALVAAARHEPTTYQPILNTFFSSLDHYWDSKAAIPGYEPSPTAGNGRDKYYDDNQWMVITFTEAYDLTHNIRFLDRADETLKFSLSGWDDKLGGGIWWHEKHKGGAKNTCSNAPAAVAALCIARHRNRAENIEWAQKLVKWTTENLQDKDGLFLDNKKVSNGRIDRRKYTYNSALMIRANLGLYRATADDKFLTEAKRISAACTHFNNPKTGAYHDSLRFTHLLVEADLELYRATNDAAILARAQHNGEVTWKQYQESPPKALIEQASIARMLWLLADHETEVGREFWKKVHGEVAASK